MSKSEFYSECLYRLIDPSIALENERVLDALENRNDAEVIRLLNEEF